MCPANEKDREGQRQTEQNSPQISFKLGFNMLSCCPKLNSVTEFVTQKRSNNMSSLLFVRLLLQTSLSLRDDQKQCHLCVLQHCRADYLCVRLCICSNHVLVSVWICMLHILSPLALIIFGARPRAEVSGDPPTLVQHVCVCGHLHVCASLCAVLA